MSSIINGVIDSLDQYSGSQGFVLGAVTALTILGGVVSIAHRAFNNGHRALAHANQGMNISRRISQHSDNTHSVLRQALETVRQLETENDDLKDRIEMLEGSDELSE